mgnify:CR=1 FL=1
MKNNDQDNQQALNVEGSGLIPLDLQFFADDGGDGGDPDNSGGNPDNSGGSHEGSGGNPEDRDVKTFTQEDVNNIAAKEAKKAQEKILKQLGIEDFERAKEGMQRFREWQDQQKTEAERQAERLKELESKYEQATKQNEIYQGQLLALKAGVLPDNVEDVVALAKSKVSEDVDMEEAISQIVEKYPHFKGEEEKKSSFSTGNHGDNSDGLSEFGRVLLGKK